MTILIFDKTNLLYPIGVKVEGTNFKAEHSFKECATIGDILKWKESVLNLKKIGKNGNK